MKDTGKFFFVSNFVSLVCVLAAVYLILEAKDGWGWFLFIAFVLGDTWNSDDDKDK